MEVEFTGLHLLIGAVIILNILVNIKILLRDDFDKTQKGLQSAIVWLFPFIGAILLYLFMVSIDDPIKKPSKPFGGGPRDSGVSSGTDH